MVSYWVVKFLQFSDLHGLETYDLKKIKAVVSYVQRFTS